MVARAWRIPPAPLFLFHDDFQLSRAYGPHEDLVVAFGLVRIGDGEVRDGLVELSLLPR